MNIRGKGKTHDSGDVVLALSVDGCNLSFTFENIRPLRSLMPMKLARLMYEYLMKFQYIY